MRDKVAAKLREKKALRSKQQKNVTSFLFVLRLAKDLARTLRLGTKGFFGGGVTKHITTHPSYNTVVENHSKMSPFLKIAITVFHLLHIVSCLFTF